MTGGKCITALLLGAAVLTLLGGPAAAQQVVVPKGELAGPTPFGSCVTQAARARAYELARTHASACPRDPPPARPRRGPCAVGAYYFNWYNLEEQWQRYSTTRSPVLGHYDQSVRVRERETTQHKTSNLFARFCSCPSRHISHASRRHACSWMPLACSACVRCAGRGRSLQMNGDALQLSEQR